MLGVTPQMVSCHQITTRVLRLLPCIFLGTCLLLTAKPLLADDELDFGLEEQRLYQIQLSGNVTFSDNVLKNVLQIREPSWKRFLEVPRYTPHLIETQLNLLGNYYRNRGFHQVAVVLDSVVTLPEKGDVLSISIAEGPRTLISNVRFTGIGSDLETEILSILRLVEGQPAPVDLNALGGDIFGIIRLFQNQAHMRVKVVPEMTLISREDSAETSVEILYKIDPGRVYFVREVRLVGNRRTDDNLLTRELVIHKGQPLNWDRLEDSRHRLLRTSLFRDVAIVPVEADTLVGEVTLEVRVVERKAAFYELGLGTGSQERVRVLAAWGHRNLWGSGRSIQVRGRSSWNVEEVVGNPVDFSDGQINFQISIQPVIDLIFMANGA